MGMDVYHRGHSLQGHSPVAGAVYGSFELLLWTRIHESPFSKLHSIARLFVVLPYTPIIKVSIVPWYHCSSNPKITP
jgi:hypothetical protein